MAKYSLQAEFERAEEARKICKYNLENQMKILDELNLQIAKVKKQIADNTFSSAYERSKQIMLNNTLNARAKRLKTLIPELKDELKAAEERFTRIKELYNHT